MVLSGSIGLGLVALVGGFLHYRRERLLSHEERMKALELGREMPDDVATARIKTAFGTRLSGGDDENPSESLPRKVFSTTLWIAFWGFASAAQGGTVNMAVAIGIAASTAAIGVTGLICGTILAMRNSATSSNQSLISKPHVENDAYDFVSRRG
jgi:hypothetical protein